MVKPFGNLAGMIGNAIRQGISANAFQRSIIGTGLGINRQSLLRAFGQVREALSAQGRIGALRGDVPVPDAAIVDWGHAPATGFLHHVRVLVRLPGKREVDTLFFNINSDTPLSPADAEQQAMDIASSATEPGGSGEGQDVLGGFLSGVYVKG
ncbi:MAG TPA: hypothetical protein VIV12_23540 [Streptosporangiaceae bacterium]